MLLLSFADFLLYIRAKCGILNGKQGRKGCAMKEIGI